MNENLEEFMTEWNYYELCITMRNINLYGFTMNPDTSNYMVIMDYADKGNLRENLTKIIKKNWKDKLFMLNKIINGLNVIHMQNIIHYGFHDDLMKKCWNEDPLKRPSTPEVTDIIRSWIFYPEDENLTEELINIAMKFIDAPIECNNFTTESHPQAYYKSRLQDFTSEKLNEILENKHSDYIITDKSINDTNLNDKTTHL
ncbi:kinase-like domain-containing protein [Rhizophagus clarus]|uniref:Kinase-like domain-containing protein n=1 Tax=Rhizophagus clarus TaxID=94130 RepID=A0A8H3LFC8_9GLOM|nr:kinase-like domain-containing protein [Rhizophagus clarus]